MKTYVELVSSKDRPPPIGKQAVVLADELWQFWTCRSWSMFPKNHQWIDPESRIEVPTDDAELIAWHRAQIAAIEKRLEEKKSEYEQARREKAKAFIAATGMTRDDVVSLCGVTPFEICAGGITLRLPFATFSWSSDPQRVYYATDVLCKRWTGVLLSDLDEQNHQTQSSAKTPATQTMTRKAGVPDRQEMYQILKARSIELQSGDKK